MLELHIDDNNSKQKAVMALKNKLNDCVFICIGTEKVLADSIGPRVGSLLNENMNKPLFVYGLSEANITAQNLEFAITMIRKLHPNNKIAVIDAAVGEQNQVGKVQICQSAITPGAATNKNLQTVGDVSIVGIIANKNMSDFYQVDSEKSILVEKLSQFIATTILLAVK